ncbi:MAG TPA: NADP transhydrogenase subunit alpha [Candidatus Atribacteria bacterium]|nr:NADP transhydrogenase subunit alpha [Candidatus Atribacteria bacterium]
MKVTVIGAGNGGLAIASHLALKGHVVNLYSIFKKELEPIILKGGIELSSLKEEGFAVLNKVTNDIKLAIDGADLIMVVTPANAHAKIAKDCAPYLKEDQVVILNPGRTGGALEFDKVLTEERIKNKPIIGEAQTLIYACRKISSTKVVIYGVKKSLSVASFPAKNMEKLVRVLNKAYPQFVPAINVLETSLNNIGAIFHPAPTILNSARIESGEKFDYYHEGITPVVATVLESIDRERLEVAKALKVKVQSAKEFLKESYEVEADSLYQAIQNNMAYKGVKAPTKINIRYLTEDIPMSLVPIASIGYQLGVPTPNIDSIIKIGSTMLKTDFRKLGRTVDKLGLNNLSSTEIINLVNG